GLTQSVHLFFTDGSHHPEFVNEDKRSSFLIGFLFNTHLSKTSRASVSGTKIGRMFNFFGTLNIFNLGKIYKHSLDTFVEKNQERILKQRRKEMIKLTRRGQIIHTELKDKVDFFRQIHMALHSEKEEEKNVLSSINPLIL